MRRPSLLLCLLTVALCATVGAVFAQDAGRSNPQPDEIKALREEMLTLIAANDRRYMDALASQKEATTVGFATLREATTAAISAADRATTKAEGASDKRFESVNEFRRLVDDQQRTFMPRPEAENTFESLKVHIAELKDELQKSRARGSGVTEGWGYAAGVLGLLALALTVFFTLRKK